MREKNSTPIRGGWSRAWSRLGLTLLLLPLMAETRRDEDATTPVGAVVLTATPERAAVAELSPLVVSALRVPRAPELLSSSITALEPQQLRDEGYWQLRDALNQIPGVLSISTAGQQGAVASLNLRGLTTRYSQVCIDGVRLDPSMQLGNLLSAVRMGVLGRVELLRGMQGSAYGGEAAGGVLWLETPQGRGAARSEASVEAGSFGSLMGQWSTQGESRGTGYFLNLGHELTQNDGEALDYKQSRLALRLDATLSDIWSWSGSVWAVQNESQQNDPSTTGATLDAVEMLLLSSQWQARHHAGWKSRLSTGFQQERYDSDYSGGTYGTDVQAGSVAWDEEWQLSPEVTLLHGVFGYRTEYDNTIGAHVLENRYGAHADLDWLVADHVTAQLGARWEDHAAFGQETTGRGGIVLRPWGDTTLVRGGYGTSFRSPTYLDLFGSSYGAGNPLLSAEQARGWDCGIEQKWGETQSIAATWFRNEISDAIVNRPFPQSPTNRPGTSVAQGMECSWEGRRAADSAWSYRGAWTYLPRNIGGQPRHALTARLAYHLMQRWTLGAGVTAMSPHSWGGSALAGSVVTRLDAQYVVSDTLKIGLRVENLFNEDYQLSNFYGDVKAGPGTAIHVGLTQQW